LRGLFGAVAALSALAYVGLDLAENAAAAALVRAGPLGIDAAQVAAASGLTQAKFLAFGLAAVLAARREQAAVAHEVLESRLAAMQAQVEPRFLFDTLVDIESLYRQDPQQAAANLDRLITYLRAALPRLRESGSTVDAELDLVRAYLEVVTALHGGRPRLTISFAEECRRSRFYPMLLLPLVQRAVRHPSGILPQSISLDVRRVSGETVVALRIQMAGGCADDPELARVRERLAGLYGTAARLDCVEVAGGATELTMHIPADGTAAAR
jgi:LytS/YehU family sensor histidine kinase